MYVDEIRAYTPQNGAGGGGSAADSGVHPPVSGQHSHPGQRDRPSVQLRLCGHADGTRCSWPTTIFTRCGPGRAAMRTGRAICSPWPCGKPGRRRGWSISAPLAPPSPPWTFCPCVGPREAREVGALPSASQCVLPAGGRRARRLQIREGENSRVGWLPAERLLEYTNEWQMDGVYAKLLARARELLRNA